MLALIIGDLHVPHKASDLPLAFKELLVPGKIDHLIFTGNLTDLDAYHELRKICPMMDGISGTYDTLFSKNLDCQLIDGYKILIVRESDLWPSREIAFGLLQQNLKPDCIVVGNARQPLLEISELNGTIVIYPGSASSLVTGHGSMTTASATPTFVLLDLRKDLVSIYTYKCLGGEQIKVDQWDFEWQQRASRKFFNCRQK